MADPLTLTASIASVTFPALHALRLFLDDIHRIQDVPDALRTLEDDVHSAELALTSLQGVPDQEWESLGRAVAEESRAVVSTCTKACDAFRADLLRWTSHSRDGKLSLRDRATVGFFKQDRVRCMSEQLQSCKITINSVVSIATLYSSIRHTQITEEIRKTISTRQTEITSHARSTDEQLAQVESRIKDLSVSRTEDDDDSTMDTDELRQIDEEHRALRASRKLLDELLGKAQENTLAKAATSQNSAQVTFGNQNSGFQAGVINGSISGISFGGK